jgi:RNA polymerase sigma factor (sigma-70 family)
MPFLLLWHVVGVRIALLGEKTMIKNKVEDAVRLSKLLGMSVQELRYAEKHKLIPLIRLRRVRLAPTRRKYTGSRPAIQQDVPDKPPQTQEVQPALDENQLYDRWRNAPQEEKPRWEQQLYQRVVTHARAVVVSMLGEDDRDLPYDIASEVVLQLQSFQQKSKFSTYAHSIARNKVLQKKRDLARYRRTFVAYDDLKQKKPRSADPCDPSDFCDPLPSIGPLIQLPDGLNQQERLLLKTMSQGGSVVDIAEGLGITISAAESRWRRLKNKLEKKSARNDGEPGLSATKLTEAPCVHPSLHSTPKFLYVGCSPELYAEIMAKEREPLYRVMTREELERISNASCSLWL